MYICDMIGYGICSEVIVLQLQSELCCSYRYVIQTFYVTMINLVITCKTDKDVKHTNFYAFTQNKLFHSKNVFSQALSLTNQHIYPIICGVALCCYIGGPPHHTVYHLDAQAATVYRLDAQAWY